ncbi:MAG: hypothetical protein HY814_08545 [Candidatus Riflebacteria bacterium]|nr:hypothetical protein [Candidatus Riflebacteria bacterium]
MPAWDPDSQQAALFHRDRGYVPNHQAIDPGEYFLIAAESSVADCTCEATYRAPLEYGDCDLGVWSIKVETGLRLGSLVHPPRHRPAPVLQWRETAGSRLLEGAAQVMTVWVGAIPEVLVGNWTAEARARHRILQRHAGKVTWLEPEDAGDGQVIVRPTARSGELRLQSFGRRHEPVESVLRYVVLPECRIEWPGGLLDARAKAVVRLTAPVGATIEWDPPAPPVEQQPLPEQRTLTTWHLQPESALLEGTMEVDGVQVQLARRVRRFDVVGQGVDDHGVRVLTPERLEPSAPLRVFGLPGETMSVVLETGADEFPLTPALPMPPSGVWQTTGATLRDGLAAHPELASGIFGGRCGSRVAVGRTLFVRTEVLDASLSRVEVGALQGLERDSVPPSYRAALDLAMELAGQAVKEVRLPAIPEEFRGLRRVLARYAFGAILFDRSRIADSEGRALDDTLLGRWLDSSDVGPIKAADSLVGRGQPARHAGWTRPGEADIAYWPFARWRDRLRQAIARAPHDADLAELLEEWHRKESRQPDPSGRSRLARLCGREWYPLALAANLYLKGRPEEAAQSLNKVEAPPQDSRVQGLKSILHAMSLIRAGCDEFAGAWMARQPTPRLSLAAVLWSAIRVLVGVLTERAAPDHEAVSGPLPASAFTGLEKDDFLLARACSEGAPPASFSAARHADPLFVRVDRLRANATGGNRWCSEEPLTSGKSRRATPEPP